VVLHFQEVKNNSVLGCYIMCLIFVGRFTFRNENVLSSLDQRHCLAIKYVDDDGKPTQAYPLNPNGSPCKSL
jgi:phosphoribosylformylglycinamidine synthase